MFGKNGTLNRESKGKIMEFQTLMYVATVQVKLK